jgi:hypothetical protein
MSNMVGYNKQASCAPGFILGCWFVLIVFSVLYLFVFFVFVLCLVSHVACISELTILNCPFGFR